MYSLQLVHLITTQSIKNGVNRFYVGFTWVLRENSANTKVNDTKDFEASKLGRTIEWE